MNMNASPPSFVARAPRDVDGWAALFVSASQLPVLPATADVIEEWRTLEDHVDAHQIAESIAGDPLMTLKLLAHVALMRRSGGSDERRGDIETVTEALVLLGIGPFFRAFGPQTTIEQTLAGQDDALIGLHSVLRRSRRAANFALGFAAHRMDHDAAVIYEATLLHGFAELLLWLRAPALALDVAHRQQREPGLRSAVVQREVLGIELSELQQALMKAWRLPSLLCRVTDDRHADDVQMRNVHLAVRLARHTSKSWEDPAVPDDLVEIGQLLQLGEIPTRRLLIDIDEDL